MKRTSFTLLTALFTATAALPAKDLLVLPGSTATFVVHARHMFTHEVINGVNTGVSGTVSVPAASGGPVTAHIEIDAAGFKTGDDLRDEHVRGALRSKIAPKIAFDLQSLPGFDAGAAQGQTLTAQGTFSVGGHSVSLSMPVSVAMQNGRWKVHGEAVTGFKALQVTPPGIPVMVSVEDALTVKVDLLVGE